MKSKNAQHIGVELEKFSISLSKSSESIWQHKLEHDQLLKLIPRIQVGNADFIRESNNSVIHEYTFEEKIGKGNYGTVY